MPSVSFSSNWINCGWWTQSPRRSLQISEVRICALPNTLGVITLYFVVSIHLLSPTIFSHQPGWGLALEEATCDEDERDGKINTTGPSLGPNSSLRSEFRWMLTYHEISIVGKDPPNCKAKGLCRVMIERPSSSTRSWPGARERNSCSGRTRPHCALYFLLLTLRHWLVSVAWAVVYSTGPRYVAQSLHHDGNNVRWLIFRLCEKGSQPR